LCLRRGQAIEARPRHSSALLKERANNGKGVCTMSIAMSRVVRQTGIELVSEAGAILLKYFGRVRDVRQKEHPSSVVCEADLASEKHIVAQIRRRFPQDGIIAEESGCQRGSSEFTWVVDPLDGTSNFVSGVPWFGVQLGVLRNATPIFAAMYLPIERALYHAEAGGGAWKNGKRAKVTSETRLKNVLCAFGFDARSIPRRRQEAAALLMRVAGGVRNTRATNSLVDFCYTLNGGFGACINLNCKIWDIVPISLVLPEAGGTLTDLEGNQIAFQLGQSAGRHIYQLLGAGRALHPQLLALTRSRRQTARR
jgi:myo-inositol-1(or 4)-monophosphatase